MLKKIPIFFFVCFMLMVSSCSQSGRADLDLLMSGKDSFFQEKYQQALRDFQKSARINPRNDVSIAYIGFCYYHLKQTSPALSNFNKALSLNPRNNIALFGKSLVIWDMGEYLDAYLLFDSVSNINPKHDKAFYYKAMANLKFHDTTQAINNLTYAIKNAPNYAEPYYLLSSIYLKEKQQTIADSLLKLATENKRSIRKSFTKAP